MKKYIVSCAALCAVLSLASCGTSKDSAYRKAYEKAKAQEQASQQGQQVEYQGAVQYQQPVQQQQVYQQPVQQQPVYQQPVQQQPVQQQPVAQQPVQQQPVYQQPVQQQPAYQQPVQQQPVVTQIETAPVQNTQAPVQQPQAVQNTGLRAFSVVVSSSGNQAAAENLRNTLRNAGYSNAQVVPNGANFRVVASTYDSREDAVRDKNTLSSQYPGAWIMAK